MEGRHHWSSCPGPSEFPHLLPPQLLLDAHIPGSTCRTGWAFIKTLKDMLCSNHSSICLSNFLPWLLPPTAMTELENLEERTPASYLASLLRSVLTLTVLGQSPFHEVQLGTEVEQETRAKARGI